MKWTEKNTLLFIEAYKRREVLWNTKHSTHFNKNYRNDAWEEIAAEMGTTAEECRKKITTLLSALRREKLKIKRKRGSDRPHKSSWFAFKSLLFLWEKDKHRDSQTTMDLKRVDIMDQSLDLPILPSSNIPTPLDTLGHSSHHSGHPEKVVPVPETKKKEKVGSNGQPQKNTFERVIHLLKKECSDEHDKFGANVSAKLRKMDENQRLFAENVINTALFKGQLNQLTEFSTVSTPLSDKVDW